MFTASRDVHVNELVTIFLRKTERFHTSL